MTSDEGQGVIDYCAAKNVKIAAGFMMRFGSHEIGFPDHFDFLRRIEIGRVNDIRQDHRPGGKQHHPFTEDRFCRDFFAVLCRIYKSDIGFIAGNIGICVPVMLGIMYGKKGLAEMKAVKAALDPKGLLCPGNLFGADGE